MDRANDPRRVRFGVFELDVRTGELRKSGERLRLQDQPFQILRELVLDPGELVTRKRLRETLWPEETYVDFDHSLNAAVKKLRDALGDDARSPRFIETLPKKGYRFLPPVEPVVGRYAARNRMKVAAISSVAALASFAALALWPTSEPTQLRATSKRRSLSVPLTSLRGHERHPDLSPDGKKAAFVWDGGPRNNDDVYVKRVDSDGLDRLTHDPAPECCPAWSPDGNRIAFLRPRGTGAELLVIPPEGGTEKRLARLSHLGEKICWSPDGKSIAVEDWPEGEAQGIFFISTKNGEKRRITSAPAGSSDRWPTLSPKGRTLAFGRGKGLFAIHTLDLGEEGVPATGPNRVTRDEYPVGGLDWTPDGRELVFGAYTEEVGWRLWKIAAAVEAGGPTPLGMQGAQPSFAAPPFGSEIRLAYVSMSDDANIYRLRSPAATDTSGQAHELIAGSSRSDSVPRLTAQGDRVVFVSGRSGHGEIWTMRSDGSEQKQITTSGRVQVGTPDWSPDGRLIGFNGLTNGSFDVYVVDAEGGVPRALTDAPSTDGGPAWSRDGRWVYFMSDRTGRPEIWKKPANGGDAIQVTFKGGHQAIESPDGRWLYYSKSIRRPGAPESLPGEGEPGIFRMPLQGGPEERVLEEGVFGRWTVSRTGIYLLSGGRRGASIDFVAYDTWERKTIATFPRGSRFGMANSLTVSLDDRWIVYAKYDHTASDLMLVSGY